MKQTYKLAIALIFVTCALLLPGCALAAGETAVDTITTEVVSVALDIVATFIVALIGVAGAWTTAKIGQNKKLTNISEAINQVVQAAQLTVGELQQTIVDRLKQSQGGKLTDAQIEDLKKCVLQKTKEKLTAPTVQLLGASKMDLNALIQGAAENLINEMHTVA